MTNIRYRAAQSLRLENASKQLKVDLQPVDAGGMARSMLDLMGPMVNNISLPPN